MFFKLLKWVQVKHYLLISCKYYSSIHSATQIPRFTISSPQCCRRHLQMGTRLRRNLSNNSNPL